MATSTAVRDRYDVYTRRARSYWARLTPPQVFVGSFALLIMLGTLGFGFLPGLYTTEPMSWLDALFTTTSAVCVTGLSVIDVSKQLTFFGQAWLLLLIQLGGLGVLTFSSILVLMLGGRLSLRHEACVGSLDGPITIDSRRLLVHIIRFTLILELIASGVLFLCWLPYYSAREAAWHALFHSVSAFCNAGFSTFPDNLVGVRDQPLPLLVVMLLIVAGGLGFLPMSELYTHAQHRRAGRQPTRLSLHTRLVLITTFWLIVGGWILFTVLEWNRTLQGLPIHDRIVNALLLSVTPRTAGFNTIDYSLTTESTNFLTILLMGIGGSPGSTAGGMKTTTIALVALQAWSRYRGEEIISVQGRSIREELMGRAVGLCVVAMAVTILGVFLLTVSEEYHCSPGGFAARLFEAVSAFNTVGLSMNFTGQLSSSGRIIVIVLMFLGRVGTTTFATAIALTHHRPGQFRYAYEDVSLG